MESVSEARYWKHIWFQKKGNGRLVKNTEEIKG